MKTIKKDYLLLIVACLLLSIFSCTEKDSPTGPDSDNLGICPYAGEWEGTTSLNYPIYFRVTEDWLVDTLSIRVKMKFPSLTCIAYFFSDTTIEIGNKKFEMFLSSPITNLTTTVHGTFTSETEASGSNDEDYQTSFFIYCGNYFSIGTGSARLYEGTWTATKISN